MATERPVIASQATLAIDKALLAHPSRPRVLPAPDARPWEAAPDADYLIARPGPAWATAPAERPRSWPGRLRWIQTTTAGVDAFPRWFAIGVDVSCARGVFTRQVADYVMAAIHLAAKPFDRVAPLGPADWKPVPSSPIAGSTVGIVGFGSIGEAVARRALGNDMNVVAVRNQPIATSLANVRLLPDLQTLFSLSDHILLSLPDTPQTRRIVDAQLLTAVRPGAHLINIGRGTAIDEEALLAALDDGPLGQATLDVTHPEPPEAGSRLYCHPAIRLTPHLAQNFTLAQPDLQAMILENYARVIAGQKPIGLVDPALGY